MSNDDDLDIGSDQGWKANRFASPSEQTELDRQPTLAERIDAQGTARGMDLLEADYELERLQRELRWAWAAIAVMGGIIIVLAIALFRAGGHV